MSAQRFDRPIVDDVNEKNAAMSAGDAFVERSEIERGNLVLRPQKRCFYRQAQDEKTYVREYASARRFPRKITKESRF
jgi:hypothetical protein